MSSIVVAGDVSGSVTLQAPSASGSSTLTLPAVTDTLVGKATTDTLTNKSIVASQLTGTVAVARLPAGSVLQVVSATYSTMATSSSSTYADSGLTATITPSSATSKILVMVVHAGISKTTNNTQVGSRLLRDATVISNFGQYDADSTSASTTQIGSSAANVLDAPATTSATIYKTQFNSQQNNALARVHSDSAMSTLVLMEIAV